MHMAISKILIFLLPLLVISCAQVGQISGGEKDEFAPHPIDGLTNPPNQSTSFQGNSIDMTFNEFIQLNSPQQTLVIVPNHVKPKASVRKKTLHVEWEEPLQENTTYVIYMNGTVKDVTENNDSLLTYVFSTGDKIDSLHYTITVMDAWSNEAVKDANVGLFTENDSVKPYYFAKTNRFGVAQFEYLKKGTYQLRAFVDANKDLQIQPTEKIAFRSEPISLDSSRIDTIPLRLFTPSQEEKITSFKFQAPGSFLIGTNYSLENVHYFINGQEVDKDQIKNIERDSVQLFTQVKGLSTVELVIQSNQKSDTSSLRLSEKDKLAPLKLNASFDPQNCGPHEMLTFELNDLIKTVDASKISLIDPTDSTNVTFTVSSALNRINIEADRSTHKLLSLTFKKGAVKSVQDLESDSIAFILNLKTEKDYGNIHLDASAFTDQILVDLLQDDKIIRSVVLSDQKKTTFDHLLPGDYSFRIIRDQNKNAIWDTGNRILKIQAEEVLWFSKPTKVRANWDIDVNLSPLN